MLSNGSVAVISICNGPGVGCSDKGLNCVTSDCMRIILHWYSSWYNFSSLLKYFNMFEYKTFPSVVKYFITGQLAHDRDGKTFFPHYPQLEFISSISHSLKQKMKGGKGWKPIPLKCPISLQKWWLRGQRYQVKQFNVCWSWNAAPTRNCMNIDPRIQGEMGLAPATL